MHLNKCEYCHSIPTGKLVYGLFIDDYVLQQMKTYNLMSQKTGILWRGSILVSQSSWLIIWNSVSGGLDYIWVTRRTADWTVVEKTITDTVHEEGKTQKVTAKKAGCRQRAVSGHTRGKSGFPRQRWCWEPRRFTRSEVRAAVCQPISETILLLTSFMEMLISFPAATGAF